MTVPEKRAGKKASFSSWLLRLEMEACGKRRSFRTIKGGEKVRLEKTESYHSECLFICKERMVIDNSRCVFLRRLIAQGKLEKRRGQASQNLTRGA